jgi:tetratricopeptide (TPR) repeat protein
MKKMIGAFLCLYVTIQSIGQQKTNEPAIIYGPCTIEQLKADPYGSWFASAYDQYTPDSTIVDQLKREMSGKWSIRIFFGSWCGDSKRELPRFIKLLTAISFPMERVTMIGVGNGDSLYKQSPGHEEAGQGVFRVPVFIVNNNGKEINRINEYPVHSLEKDLLGILSKQPYSPNYRSFGLVQQWLNEGSLLHKNTNIRGLAEQVRYLVSSEHELNSLGYLLIKQAKKEEALQLFRINYYLYPESSNTASSLGEGYLLTGDKKQAVGYLEHSITLNKDPNALQEILTLLYKAKELN